MSKEGSRRASSALSSDATSDLEQSPASGGATGGPGVDGNSVLRRALGGDSLGGVGAVLRSAWMRSAAGVSDSTPDNSDLQRAIASGGGMPLPGPIQARMEQAFGHDFDHVRIHTGSGAGQAADALAAEAFTVGSHVFFG